MSSQGEVNTESIRIIAIETATEACSASLLISTKGEPAGKEKIVKRFTLAPREHTKLILPMLDDVLEEAGITLADIDAIAFGRGPGAFTGLRIAASIAQGLALSVDKPTISISSLMAMAANAQKESPYSGDQRIVVAIDARMGEVYWAEYTLAFDQDKKRENLSLVGEEQLTIPSVMFERVNDLLQESKVTVIGSGWDVYLEAYHTAFPDSQSFSQMRQKFPDAEEISQLALLAFKRGDIQTIEDAQPVYLRNNVAEKSKKQR